MLCTAAVLLTVLEASSLGSRCHPIQLLLGLSSQLADGCLVAGPSHGLSSLCAREIDNAVSSSFYKAVNLIMRALPSQPVLHLLIKAPSPSTITFGGPELQHTNWGRKTHVQSITVAFSIFTILCNYHHYLILKLYHHPKRKLHAQALPILPAPQPWQPPVSSLSLWTYLFWLYNG